MIFFFFFFKLLHKTTERRKAFGHEILCEKKVSLVWKIPLNAYSILNLKKIYCGRCSHTKGEEEEWETGIYSLTQTQRGG